MTPEEITHLSNEALTVDIPSYHINKRSGFRSVKYNDQKRIEKDTALGRYELRRSFSARLAPLGEAT